MENSEPVVEVSCSGSREVSSEILLDKESLEVVLDEGENFYPLLESSVEDTMASSQVPVNSYMDKFKQLHESKVKAMNLEQIEGYCKEFIEGLQKGS